MEVPDVTRLLSAPRQNPASSDLYIAEFPKSGITLLTILLANALLAANGYRARATFTSVRSYIVDLCVGEHIESHVFNDPPLRLYKTHSIFSEQFIHSIYLVRHPADVMASYLRYAQGRNWWTNGEVRDFLDHPEMGIASWQRHVDSWLRLYSSRSDVSFIHLLRYEDLVADPLTELKKLNENFGWRLPEVALTEAVSLASRDEIRRQEKRYAAHNPNHQFEFVSAGHGDQNQIIVERVNHCCREQLDLLGY